VLCGESFLNDIVTIIIFNAVLDNSKKEMTAGTGFLIVLDFLLLTVLSLLIGILFGAAASFLLKHFRILARDSVAECIFLFATGYLCYVTSESLSQSAIISLLTCGVMMAHYAWYNLSPQG